MRTCAHLAPLERLLAVIGRKLGPGLPCPHDTSWGTWYVTDAALDVHTLHRRVGLDACVRGEAYEASLSDGDVTFYCSACRKAIVGRLPRDAARRADRG